MKILSKLTTVFLLNFLIGAAFNNAYSDATNILDIKATDQSTVLKTVNGSSITRDQVLIFLRTMQGQGQKITPDVESAVLNELVLRELVASEARKQNLDTSPEVVSQSKFMQQQILVEAWFLDYFKQHPITEEAVRAEYTRQLELTKSGRNSHEYLVSQILLSTEKEAGDVSKRLDSKESFEKIAQEKSIDKASAVQGGKLGWIVPSNIIKPLDDIIISLKKGIISNPVQTSLGWHILKVDETRVFKIPSYEAAKANLIKGIMDAERKELIEKLAKKAIIKEGLSVSIDTYMLRTGKNRVNKYG